MATPKELFEGQIATKINEDPEKAKQIGAVYHFEITGEGGGDWIIDLKDNVGVRAGKEDAGCTVTLEAADFCDLVEGKSNGQMLFMSGKLKVAGDMSLAMKLGQVLGQ